MGTGDGWHLNRNVHVPIPSMMRATGPATESLGNPLMSMIGDR